MVTANVVLVFGSYLNSERVASNSVICFMLTLYSENLVKKYPSIAASLFLLKIKNLFLK